MVQPEGMPDASLVQDVIEASFTNVPEDATLSSQLSVHPKADISVAKHLI